MDALFICPFIRLRRIIRQSGFTSSGLDFFSSVNVSIIVFIGTAENHSVRTVDRSSSMQDLTQNNTLRQNFWFIEEYNIFYASFTTLLPKDVLSNRFIRN